jgi:hypothetical protein
VESAEGRWMMSECPQDRLAVFEKMARKEFAFLETEYCFQVTTLKPENADRIVIQYRSESVYLMLHYGPPEYALDFSFERLGIEDQEDAHGFTSGDLLYLDGTDNWSDYPGYSTYELSNLREFLPKLAQLLRECGHSCLRGDVQPSTPWRFVGRRTANVGIENMNATGYPVKRKSLGGTVTSEK